ncbi:MAG: hypothetical protein K8I82_20295 [Anaerolineae bacterium]|nr:hypothetical protein [Anaerolineae bacterium]
MFEKAYESAFWASDAGLYMKGLQVKLALAVLDAHLAGLTRDEITTAVKAGEEAGMPCDQHIGSQPRVERPHYWEQVEAEAYAYWKERLQLREDKDDLYNE